MARGMREVKKGKREVKNTNDGRDFL